MNSIVISMISHSEIGVMFTNLAIFRGPHYPGDTLAATRKNIQSRIQFKLVKNESYVFFGLYYTFGRFGISAWKVCVCVYGALLKTNCCCCVRLAASKGNRQAQKSNEAKREQRFPGIKIPDKQVRSRQNNPDSQVKRTNPAKPDRQWRVSAETKSQGFSRCLTRVRCKASGANAKMPNSHKVTLAPKMRNCKQM